MPSCNTYHLTWFSLTLGVGYLFTAAPAKRSRCSLPLDEGYLLTAALPDLKHGLAPLGPLAPAHIIFIYNIKQITKIRAYCPVCFICEVRITFFIQ